MWNLFTSVLPIFLSFWHLPASTPSSLALHFPVLNKCHCYTAAAAAERITTRTKLDDATAQPRRMSVTFTSRPVWGISYSHFLFLHPPACDPQMPSWRMSEIMKCISRRERACWRGNERMYGCVLCGHFSAPMTEEGVTYSLNSQGVAKLIKCSSVIGVALCDASF